MLVSEVGHSPALAAGLVLAVIRDEKYSDPSLTQRSWTGRNQWVTPYRLDGSWSPAAAS